MKKRVTALLTALCCLCAPMTAYAESVDVDVEFTYMTDTFTYRTNHRYGDGSGFYLESEIADPDFMVVGYFYRDESPEIYCYAVTPINDDHLIKCGTGQLELITVESELGDQELEIGDLLKIDGEIDVAECDPAIYCPAEPGTMSYLGNGIDVFGEEFARVIRMQMYIDLKAYYESPDHYFGLHIVHGDVNVDDTLSIVDCVMLNKSLMGDETLCDYAELAADFDKNGEVTHEDSLSILKRLVGLV